jgi:O-antigen ligase
MLEHIRMYRDLVLMVFAWVVLGNINTELAMFAVIGSVLLLLRAKRYIELMLGFVTILVLSDSFLESLKFAQKVKDIYLVLLSLNLFFDKSLTKDKNIIFVNFLPFLIWALCMIPRSPVPVIAAQKTISYGLIFLVAPFYFMKLIREYGVTFFKSYFWAISIILVSGLILGMVHVEKGYLLSRFRGLFGNPNGIGVFCAMITLVLLTVRSRIHNVFNRIELMWLVGLILLCVLLSGSRNSLITIVFFFAFMRAYKMSKWFGFSVLLFLIVLYEIVISNLPAILGFFGVAEMMRAESLESGSGRFIAWGFALKIINSDTLQFFLGKGFSFDEFIFSINQERLIKMGHVGGVHNSFLALWLNTGIIGLILWLSGFLRTIFQTSRFSYIAMPLVFAIFFSGFFEPWLMASLNPYTIQVILMMSFLRQYGGIIERQPNTTPPVPEVQPA